MHNMSTREIYWMDNNLIVMVRLLLGPDIKGGTCLIKRDTW